MNEPDQGPGSYFLKTSRLGFRPWRESDLDDAVSLWGDPEVTRWIDSRTQLSPADVKQKLHGEMETQEKYGLQYWPCFLLENDRHVGCGGLRPHDLPGRIYELGVHLRPEYWKQGLAEEGATAVIGYAFRELGAAALFAGHHPENVASQRLLERLGFAYAGDESYGPTGLMHPSYFLERPGSKHRR